MKIRGLTEKNYEGIKRSCKRTMHRIAVISDTHGLLRPEIIEKIKDCEQIFHAGDIDRQEVIQQLEERAPLQVVRGNADKEWAKEIPETKEFDIYGFRIFMVHNKKFIKKDLSDVDVVIYGHSHIYEAREKEGVFYLNPGSCGPRRFHQAITMAILVLYEEEHRFEVEKIDVSPILDDNRKMKMTKKDMHYVINQVIKEMNAGKNIDVIAKKNRVDKDLVTQICRIYATHPGVDTDGILNRIELRNIYIM